MKYILTLLLLIGSYALQAQTSEPPKSWTPDPLEDSIKKYEKAGQYDKALTFADQWLTKTKKNPGKDSLDYAAALYHIGALYDDMGDYSKAEPLYQQALEIRKKVLGWENPDVARSLHHLGILFNKIGDNNKAETYLQQALEIRQKVIGPEHPDVGKSLICLGLLYADLQQVAKAETFYLKALQISKKIHGPEHPDIASAKNNLGILYYNSGNYTKAERFYIQAIDIWNKNKGMQQPEVASSLHNLGTLYHSLGEFSKAETNYLQALDIRKKILGSEHPDIAVSFQNLGLLYTAIGDFKKAELLLSKSVDIYKKTFGPEHPAVALSLVNLAVTIPEERNYGKQEACYLNAFEILKKALGHEHPDVAIVLNNLGVINRDMGNYRKAEIYNRMALEIQQKALNETDRALAGTLIDRGILLFHLGDYAAAETLFDRAQKINEKALGNEHPDLALTLCDRSILYRALSKLQHAKRFMKQLSNIDRKHIHEYFPFLSDKSRESFLKTEMKKRENLLSFWSEEGIKMPELRGELWNHQLFYKGLLLNTRARWKQRLASSKDSLTWQKLEDWTNLQYKIANLFTSTDSTERAGLDSLVDKAEKLEKELSQRSENFARSEERKVRTWQEVQQALKPGEAAIEMVRFRHFGIAKVVTDTSDPKKPTYRVKGLTDTVGYAALILTKTSTQPELVILPNGNDLEGRWHKYYRNSVRLQQKDAESYKQYWQPIARKLKGIKKVWFSADGVYHKLNLGTLQNPANGNFLMDELDIALLGSTKDLLREYPEESENRLACLVGNPEFQPDQITTSGKSRSGPELSYYFKPDPSLEVSALPGTQEEVNGVADILSKNGWEVKDYAGAEASEEKIKDSYKPRLMLLSTHGFFRSDSTPGSNPLLRSGLLLSGAAKTLREGRSGEGEDGILTAYEAMNLNLDNTELVVLSACETGLGEVKNGEGVYGLQRAFQVAGARKLIMSLWKVDDAVTKDLMLAFFRNWLGNDGKGELQFAPKSSDALRTAFRKAQLEIRRKHPEPYYWGGFVLLGK